MAGRASIPANGKNVSVSYTTPYNIEPIVQITPIGYAGEYYLASSSTNGFTIELANPLDHAVQFNWLALAVDGINVVS